ncbi:MAG TPA: hypothetical protein VFA41_12225 [Ktedonobacteraceae bacterium]|jgi:hypothetical protein|nr:hypothetical protein [Ktedonobacteraceae bacterium]
MELQQHEPTVGEQYGKLKKYAAIKTRLICGGLIGIGLVILSAFISAGVFKSLPGTPAAKAPVEVNVPDWPAIFSIIAFAIALPLLSALVLITFEETSRKYVTVKDMLGLRIVYWAGTLLALIGIVFAFWHIWFVAGILAGVSILIGTLIYTTYSSRLTRLDNQLKTQWNIENLRSEGNELL